MGLVNIDGILKANNNTSFFKTKMVLILSEPIAYGVSDENS